MVDAEQCLHRVTAGVIYDVLKSRLMFFSEYLRCSLYFFPPFQKNDMGSWKPTPSRPMCQSHQSQARHYMFYVNDWGTNRAMQSLLTGFRIYASSSLFVLTVTAGRTRRSCKVKPILIGIGAEGSDLQVRNRAVS